MTLQEVEKGKGTEVLNATFVKLYLFFDVKLKLNKINRRHQSPFRK